MRRAEEVIMKGSPSTEKYESMDEEPLYTGDGYAQEMVLEDGSMTSAGNSSLMAEERSHHQQQQQQAHAPSGQIDTSKVLGHVETFLLPMIDFYNRWSSKKQIHRDIYSSILQDFEVPGLCPLARLDDILYQVALADHIRTMQTMYRDAHDEHRLVSDLRADHPNTALPTKQLMIKITEGRVRSQALCRLCYGEESVEMLRATVDLAAAYALQGMWPQVSEHMAIASQKLVAATAPSRREHQILQAIKAREAAAKVECTFRILRDHARANAGLVTRHLLRELVSELTHVAKIVSENKDEVKSSEYKGNEHSSFPSHADDSPLSHPTQLAAMLHGFFIKFAQEKASSNAFSRSNVIDMKVFPSWGDVVDFLRNDCILFRHWISEMEAGILPQNRAILQIPFRQADKQKRGVSHPHQLAHYLSHIPGAVRVLAGSTLVKRLQQLRIDLPLSICADSGLIVIPPQILAMANIANSAITPNRAPVHKVLYELPVTMEEVAALHVADLDADPLDLLRAQVLTLLGVCNIFSNRLALAEDNMRAALKQIEAVGLETQVTACELYNSIAQMMIMRYRNHQSQRKVDAKKAAVQYLDESEEGRMELQTAVSELKLQIRQRQVVVPTADIISQVRHALTSQKAKSILRSENDPTKTALEAAYRYLVKSYEILLSVHGSNHPSVATACLAVASVQSITGGYELSREWLVRGLRGLEKIDPIPIRAISFVQTQLSQVLAREGHLDEAIKVLESAVRFYVSHAKDKLQKSQIYQGGLVFTPPVLRGTSLYDDVTLALDLSCRMAALQKSAGNLWAAADQAEITAELAEGAFGWDAAVAGERRKEAADCHALTGAWDKAWDGYKRAFESFSTACGKADKNSIECAKLSVVAHDELRARGLVPRTGRGRDSAASSQLEDYEGTFESMDPSQQEHLHEDREGNVSPTTSELTSSPVPIERKTYSTRPASRG